ncbi:unnamed protein product, partial [Phaeothamnion confervicola]
MHRRLRRCRRTYRRGQTIPLSARTSIRRATPISSATCPTWWRRMPCISSSAPCSQSSSARPPRPGPVVGPPPSTRRLNISSGRGPSRRRVAPASSSHWCRRAARRCRPTWSR